MSVPTVFANGCHLDLSLSGSKVAVLDSVKIKSLRTTLPPHRQFLNQNDVLPSITPSSESIPSRNSMYTPDLTVNNSSASSQVFAREVNIIIKDGSNHAEYQAVRAEKRSAPPKQVWGDEESVTYSAHSKTQQDEDLWEDEPEQTEENTDADCSQPSKKKKPKKKKKRSKSKLNNKSANKSNRLKITEDAYSDMALLSKSAQLEAFCMPVKIMNGQSKPAKKTDYSDYINEKAPSLPKNSAPNQTQILLKKAQDIICSASLKSKSFQIEKTKAKSPYLTKLENKILSASVDPLTFKIHASKSSHSVQRKSLGSAPGETAVPRIIKVYQSEKQSKYIEELGMEFPAAPPATPMPEMLKQYDYIPCMNDIRSQRAVKLKLDYMAKIEKQRQDKIKEEKTKKDKIHQKEKMKELRKQQRREIYALNKKMTEFEHKNFIEFCKQNGVSPTS